MSRTITPARVPAYPARTLRSAMSFAVAKTCNALVTSSNCTEGKASISILRGAFGEKRGAFGISAKTSTLTYALSTSFRGNPMIPVDTHLQIGSLLFEGLDQIELTGPFEVLSRVPNSTYRLYGKDS